LFLTLQLHGSIVARNGIVTIQGGIVSNPQRSFQFDYHTANAAGISSNQNCAFTAKHEGSRKPAGNNER
jgi:hypothetical protein